MSVTAKELIAVPVSLLASFAALMIWSASQGRLFRSVESRRLAVVNLLITATISAGVGVFIPDEKLPFWLISAGLPFTLLGSKTKVDPTSTTDGGKKNAFSALFTALLDVVSMLLAPFLAKLKAQLVKDRIRWAQTVNGQHRCYERWTWTKVSTEANRLYDDLCLLVGDDEDQVKLGKLDALFAMTEPDHSIRGAADHAKALRRARTAFIEMRCLAYIWGYEEPVPAGIHAPPGRPRLLGRLPRSLRPGRFI